MVQINDKEPKKENKTLIPCQNGNLEITAGNFILHQNFKEFSRDKCFPVSFPEEYLLVDPWCNALTSPLEKMLYEIDDFMTKFTTGSKDLKEYLQQIVGYFMTGDVDLEKIFILYGCSSNGKTIFISMCKKLLGFRFAHLSETELLLSHNPYSFPTSGFLNLKEKYLAFVQSESRKEINVDLLKKIMYKPTLTGCAMHRVPEDFKKECKLIISTNQFPVMRLDLETQKGIVIIPCNAHFSESPDSHHSNEYQRDLEYREKFVNNPDYIQAFFLFALHGLKKLRAKGYLEEPVEVKAMRDVFLNYTKTSRDGNMGK